MAGLFGFGGGGTAKGNAGAPAPAPAPGNGAPGFRGGLPNQAPAPAPTPSPAPAPAPAPAPPSPFENFTEVVKKGTAPKDPKATARKWVFDDITDDHIAEHVGKAKISHNFDPAKLLSIAGGNQESATALGEVLDSVYQAGLGANMKAMMKMIRAGVEHGVNDYHEHTLPAFMQQNKVADALGDAAPFMRNPAFKPMYDAMVAGFQSQYPDASAAEIQKFAKEQIAAFAETLGDSVNPNKNKQGGPGNDPEQFNTDSGGQGHIQRKFGDLF